MEKILLTFGFPLKQFFLAFTLIFLLNACTLPNQAYNLPPVNTEKSTIKKVVCPPKANTIHLRFEGEPLPLEYDKFALISSKSDISVSDDLHLMYLKNEANKSCANEILLLKSEVLVYTKHRGDNPRTALDESELPLTVREKQFSGIAVYNPKLDNTTPVDTNYVSEIRNRTVKYNLYNSEVQDFQSSAKGTLIFGSLLSLFIGYIWIDSID